MARLTATGVGKKRATRGGNSPRHRGAEDDTADLQGAASPEHSAARPAETGTRSPFSLRDEAVERALRTGEQLGLLEDLFGRPALEELRQLARDAQTTGARGGDRVLILPGIMGSKLGYARPLLFDDAIWVNPADIALGRLSELRLNGGASAIQALGVLLFAYLALKLRLRAAGHAAEFFSFDWRLSLDELGGRLAAELGRDGRRTHLVCHSMGGLVARALFGVGTPANVGRIITLGTPHNGSYSPVQAFRGVHSIVRKVAALDLRHNQADLAGIFGTFPGLLQMMPSPNLRPLLDLFDPRSWPVQGPRPDDSILADARAVEAALPALNAISFPTADGVAEPRVVLVVGTGSETVVGARRQTTADGGEEFAYDLSNDGDGTVPLDLAVVPELPTYVTSAGHGGMPNDRLVAKAVDNIIATGMTTLLPRLDPVAAVQRRAAPSRSVSDAELSAYGPRPEAVRGGLGMREQRELLVEVAAPPAPRDTVLPTTTAAFTPAGATARPPVTAVHTPGPINIIPAGPSRGLVVGRRRQQRIEVTLARGSITEVDADAYVLGVFRSVAPTGAAAAVDAVLAERIDAGGPLADLIARRMVSGGVGEITALPVHRNRRVRADAILLAGLGNIGGYSDSVLESVGESIMRAALFSSLEDFAVVPIGASAGTPSGVAISYLITGFMKALQGDTRLRGFTVCELDQDRFREIRDAFYQLLRTPLFDDVEVMLTEVDLPPPLLQRGGTPSGANRGPDPIYLLVQQELDASGAANVIGTVLTSGGKASIIKLSQPLDTRRLQQQLAKVSNGSGAIGDVSQFGSELSKLVLHPDLLTVLARETEPASIGADGGARRSAPIVVVHDAPMSRIPWEVLHLDGGVAPALLGGLSHRYNGGVLSVAKWMENRVQNSELSVLLVVDPTENLPGAVREGERIEKLLRERLPRAHVRPLRGPHARRSELLECFGAGDYDVVHYAGHAYFDAVDRARSGILCYGNEVLSGADLASLSRLPALVVFNACESARVRRAFSSDQNKVVQEKVDEPVRGTVGFAEAFLAGGVANYIGTYWPVGDNAASKFAETFYGALLAGQPIGDALLAARRTVSELAAGAADWADYVFYGDPRFVLKATAKDGRAPPAGGASEAPSPG